MSSEIYLKVFYDFIPEYLVDESEHLHGSPEDWQQNVISYSFFLGIGVGLFDEKLRDYLVDGMTPGMLDTSNLILKGFDGVKLVEHENNGELWEHSINFISNMMSLTSPETTGTNADENLIKERSPISGLIPGLRLTITDKKFANELYMDAIREKKACGEEELLDRIDFMKNFVHDVIQKLESNPH